MNTLKFTSQVKETVLILIKNRIPIKLIAPLVGLNEATVRNHLSEEYKSELSDFKLNSNNQKLHLFQVYAWLLADEVDCVASFGTPVVSGLIKLLPAYLQLEEWISFINGAIFYKNFSECNKFTPDVSVGYQKLIETLYPSPKIKLQGEKLLSEILRQMHRSEISFPAEDDINDIQKFLSLYSGKELTVKSEDQSLEQLFFARRENRYFDLGFIDYLTKVINEHLNHRQKECLESYFGITDLTTGSFLEKYDLDSERMRQIKNKALIILWRNLRLEGSALIEKDIADYLKLHSEFSAVSLELKESLNKIENLDRTAVESINSLRGKVKILVSALCSNDSKEKIMKNSDVQQIIQEDFPQVIDSLSQSEDEELQKLLRTPVEDLELSVRAFNCLKYAHIHSLRDLVSYVPEELMFFRNFGHKSLKELEEVLRQRNLRFGMVV